MIFPSKDPRKTRVVFLIRSLFFGGAERQLLTLVKGMNKAAFDISILCFYNGGELEAEFLKAGIPIISLGKSGRWDIFPFFSKLFRILRDLQPEILHSYLSMSNILAVIAKGMAGKVKVIYGVRHAYMDLTKYDLLTRLVYKMEIWLSYFADLIIVNSYTGKSNHIRNGFASKKMMVIPNGIDTDQYHPSPAEGCDTRDRLGIPQNVQVVGLVGRLDPVKDHATFLKAAAEVLQKKPDVKFICVGDGDEVYRASLQNLAQDLGISDGIIFLTGQKNIRAVYNAMDILCSASIGESFSNAIAEAMACGVPCVVTDAGDSGILVGDYGTVVPVGDVEKLASGLARMLDLSETERHTLGIKNRKRIEENFSVDRMVKRTEITLINLTKGIIEE